MSIALTVLEGGLSCLMQAGRLLPCCSTQLIDRRPPPRRGAASPSSKTQQELGRWRMSAEHMARQKQKQQHSHPSIKISRTTSLMFKGGEHPDTTPRPYPPPCPGGGSEIRHRRTCPPARTSRSISQAGNSATRRLLTDLSPPTGHRTDQITRRQTAPYPPYHTTQGEKW